MWTLARAAALRRDNYTCVECGTTAAVLEVDHIEPCWGKHAQNGCHHHLDNLQTLCHDCHVAKTNKAARDRAREARLNQGVMSLID